MTAEYGTALDVPTSVPFAKKSTFDTVPSLSLAEAPMVMSDPGVKVAPFEGVLIDTLGAWLLENSFVSGSTVASFLFAPGAVFAHCPLDRTIWSIETPSSRCWIRMVCHPDVANITGVPATP